MYTKNEDYWKNPTIENCYFAGFIAADGCLSKTNSGGVVLIIELTETDKIVLDRMKAALQYSGPLHYKPARTYTYKEGNRSKHPAGYVAYTKPSYTLCLNAAQQYHQDLLQWYNLTERKSLTLQPPNITDPEMMKAFIIGYFDGDGCLGWHKRDNCPYIYIVGTESLLRWMKVFLEHITSEQFSLYDNSQRGHWALQKKGSGVYTFLEVLSDVHVPRLERKWDIAYVRSKHIKEVPLLEKEKIAA